MGSTAQYKCYRNKILTVTRLSKKLYYHNYLQENIKSIKRTWKGINDLINHKKKQKKTITTIKCSVKVDLSHDSLEQTNILNPHFASIGQKLSSDIPSGKKKITDYLPITGNSGSFVFESILPAEIELEIMLPPLNKAHGLYSCLTRLLKSARHIMAKPLTTIVNISIQEGQFPSRLKHAKIVPFFKDGDETDPCNYRPISLLSIFHRIFDKLMYNRLKLFFNKNDVFYYRPNPPNTS